MPIKLVAYRCSICNRNFFNPDNPKRALEEAKTCEARGTPEYKYWIGMIFQGKMLWEDSFKEWIIVEKQIVYQEENHGHHRYHEPEYRVQHTKRTKEEHWIPERFLTTMLKEAKVF